MGFFSTLFGGGNDEPDFSNLNETCLDPDGLDTAEDYIREQTALYRHYDITEVQRAVSQKTGVTLSETQAIDLVQSIRDEYGLGLIRDHNLPGYPLDGYPGEDEA